MFGKQNIWSSAKLAQWGLMIITLLHLMAKPVKGYMAQVSGWMDRCQDLHRSVMVKRDLSVKVRLTIYRSIYVPTLTCGHELWVLAEKNEVADSSGGNGTEMEISFIW